MTTLSINNAMADLTVLSGGTDIILQAGSVTGITVNNGGTVIGEGGVLSGTATSAVINGGLIETGGTDAYLGIYGSLTNTKTIETVAGAGASSEIYISGGASQIKNTGTIEAIAVAAHSEAHLLLAGTHIVNSSGRIVASGNAFVDINGANISGGTLQTGAGGSIGLFGAGAATITGATVAANSEISNNDGLLTFNGGTISAHAVVEATDHGEVTLNGVTLMPGATLRADSAGLLKIGSVTTVSAGTLVLATTDGDAEIDGTNVTNQGTLEALGQTPALESGRRHSDAQINVSATGAVTNDKTIKSLANAAGGTAYVSLEGDSVTNAGALTGSASFSEASATISISASGAASNTGTIAVLANNNARSDTVSIAGDTVDNSGLVETSAGNAGFTDLAITAAGLVSNSKTIEALAGGNTNSELQINASGFTNAKGALVEASVLSSDFSLVGAVVNSGTVEFVADADAGLARVGTVTAQTLTNAGLIKSVATGAGKQLTVNLEFTQNSTNRGTVEAVAAAGGTAAVSFENASVTSNAGGTFEASASGGGLANLYLIPGTILNSNGLIVASAAGNAKAYVVLDQSTVSGGTVQSIGANAAIKTLFLDTGTITSAHIAAATTLIADGTLNVSSSTFGAGVNIESENGGIVNVYGSLANTGKMQAFGDAEDSNLYVSAGAAGSFSNGNIVEAVATTATGDEDGGGGTVEIYANTIVNTKLMEASANLAGYETDSVAILDIYGVGANSLIANSGTILAAANEADSYLTISGGTLINTNSIQLTAAGSGIDFVGGNSGGITASSIINAGIISASADMSAIYLRISAGGTFTNTKTIELVTSDGDMIAGSAGNGIYGSNIVNSGTILAEAIAGGTTHLFVSAVNLLNTKTIETLALDNGNMVAGGTVDAGLVAGNALTNAGTILAQANDASTVFYISAGALINDKTIEVLATSQGQIEADYAPSDEGIFAGAMVNSGTIVGSASGDGFIDLAISAAALTNYGTIGVVATGGGSVSADLAAGAMSNHGTIEALATTDSNAQLNITGHLSDIGSKGEIYASGNAQIFFEDGAIINDATLKTTGPLALIEATGAAAFVSTTIAANSFVEADNPSGLTATNDTIAAGGVLEADRDGLIAVSGTLTNSGTLLADEEGEVIITHGAVVSNFGAGMVKIGDGIVEVASGGTATVTFAAEGTGGLVLADTSGGVAVSDVVVSGFGAPGGADTTEYIDLANVNYAAGIVTHFTGTTASGILTVSSGGHEVAAIDLVGNYLNASFTVAPTGSGTVEITDPVGASVGVTANAVTTLAATVSPPPSLINYTGASNVALLGNYMAALFASTEGGVNATIPDTSQPQAAILARPHTT